MKKLIIPPVFVVISLALIVVFYFSFPEYNIVPFPFNFTGIAISFFGFAVMGRSRDLFKTNNVSLDFKKSSYLIQEGVFSKTRNPMYLGMFLLLLGVGFCFRNVFSIFTPFVFLIVIQLVFIPKEEKMLLEEFGQDYLDYKKRVRRWF